MCNDNHTNWKREVREDAEMWFWDFADQIVEQLRDRGEISDDLLNDYENGDTYIYEQYTDRWYSPHEAVHVLHELDEHEETDTGLWEGLNWRDLLSAKAAYTYSNAVCWKIVETIQEINDGFTDIMMEIENGES